MTVDLSKAVKGATVKFRCGGSAVIFDIFQEKNDLYRLMFRENVRGFRFHEWGESPDMPDTLFDIISITPPAFDWATVKAGDRFISGVGGDEVASTANDLMESWSERDFLLLDNLDMFKSLGNILNICQSMDDLDGENLVKATQIEALCRKAIKGNAND